MSKKNNDSIERFFRKAVVQQDTSFREKDWQKMEILLDEQAMSVAGSRSRILKRAVLSITGISIIVSAVYLGVFKPWQNGILPKVSGKLQAAAGVLGPLKKAKENPTASLLPSEKSRTLSAEANEQNPQGAESPSLKAAGTKEAVIKNKNTVAATESKRTDTLLDSPATGIYADVAKAEISKAVPTDENAQEIITTDSPMVDGDVQTLKPIVAQDQDTLRKVEEKTYGSKTHAPEEKMEKIPTRWDAAIVLAPDFSTTSFGRYAAPGAAFGLLVGYRLLKGVSLRTGLIRSFKKYEGYGNEYQPPAGYWQHRTNGIVPDEIEGACEILEIPIIIQADIIQLRRWKIYATAGVSSYRMDEESYTYSFENENPGAAAGWKSSKPSSYAFSIAHFSAAYERQLSRSFSLGIEPYLKIPFSGIGWSGVNLYTTGAYLNVRYTFLKKDR